MFKGLYLDGSGYATCPNPDITGDLTIVWEGWKKDWIVSDAEDLVSVYETSGGERSWRFGFRDTGELVFQFSADGSSGTLVFLSVDVPSTFDQYESIAIKAEVDVDPGVVTFYYAPDRDSSFVQFAQADNGGIITLNSSAADLVVGARGLDGGPDLTPLKNSVTKYVAVYSGISTGIAVEAIFENEVRGTTTFTDEQANTWTLSDNAAIIDGQTPELDLYVPDSVEEANEWAVADSPGTLSKVNMEFIDTYIGNLDFNEQDAVIDNSQAEGPFDADGTQKVRWREIGDLVFAWWEISFGSGMDIDPTGFIEIELPVVADTSFHDVGDSNFKGDILGEGHLFDSSSVPNRVLASVMLTSSNRVRFPLDTDSGQTLLSGDDPWVPASGDKWSFSALYKKAS